MRAGVIILVPAFWALAAPSLAAGPAVAAAENEISLGTGFTHIAYSENLLPAGHATGFTAGATANAGLLLPATASLDYYAAVAYQYSGGGLALAGQGSSPYTSVNAAQGRLGAGFPLAHGTEFFSYLAFGYQGWSNGAAAYRSALAGAGAKFDLPVSNRLVVSLGAQFLLMAGGSLSTSAPGVTLSSNDAGAAPQEHVELGLDGAAYGPLHLFAQAWLTHFCSASFAPSLDATQTGVNLGIGYSFY